MDKKILIVGMVAAAVALFLYRSNRPAGEVLMQSLAGQQVTLATGHVLDLSNGVIFDPLTGNYTDTASGSVIYAGAVT